MIKKTIFNPNLAVQTAVLAIVPTIILVGTGKASIGWGGWLPWGLIPALLGLAFMWVGIYLGVQTVILFHASGHGTPAPWHPPELLVREGVFAYVRNPMALGSVLLLLGEAIFFGSWQILLWTAVVIVALAVYVPMYEEIQLEKRFGPKYVRYKHSVPRWIPAKFPWKPDSK